MKLSKPNPSTTIRVVAIDADTGKSKSRTLYDTTPEQVIESLERLADDPAESAPGHPNSAA